ncbi:MAG: transposase [bacterium]|nr:transposase [bacterium]
MVHTDTMHVIHARAVGLDVHKMEITATVRRARPGTDAEVLTERFSGLEALVAWLRSQRVSAALMERTEVYWEVVYAALEQAGLDPLLVHAQHVKQIKGRKTDVADSVWLARICQFGLCAPGSVPGPAQGLPPAPPSGARTVTGAQPHPQDPRCGGAAHRRDPLGPVQRQRTSTSSCTINCGRSTTPTSASTTTTDASKTGSPSSATGSIC